MSYGNGIPFGEDGCMSLATYRKFGKRVMEPVCEIDWMPLRESDLNILTLKQRFAILLRDTIANNGL